MRTPHIIQKSDFIDMVIRHHLASDTGRDKRLELMVIVPWIDIPQYEVYDLRLDKGYQLVLSTWNLNEAIEKYNELG